MFTSARINLTIWYLLIITVISVSFSVIIYKVLTFELDRFTSRQQMRMEQRFENLPPQLMSPHLDSELISEAKGNIALNLFIINTFTIVVSGGLAYFLAGKTLNPIKLMVEDQNRFISDASHEIKTPLSSLRIAFEVFLKDKKRTLKQSNALIAESINDVDRLTSLSERLLSLTEHRTLANRKLFNKVSISNIIKKSLIQVRPFSQKKKINLKFKDKNNLFTFGNQHSLTELLVILLDNAIKYSPPKSNIFVSCKKIKNCVVISVSDQGIGIAKEDFSKIFDRFYRTDLSRSKKISNSYGLGLSIAKEIVQNHSGSIKVESQRDEGSIFTVKLPLKKA
jgi:two-component system, OmpR family, sensor histidine kinase CiaH